MRYVLRPNAHTAALEEPPAEIEPIYSTLIESWVHTDQLDLHHIDRSGRIREAARHTNGRRVVLPAGAGLGEFHAYVRDVLTHLRGRFALVARNQRGRFEARRDIDLFETEAEWLAMRDAPEPTPHEALCHARDAERERREAAEREVEQARAAEADAVARIAELEAALADVQATLADVQSALEDREQEAERRAEPPEPEPSKSKGRDTRERRPLTIKQAMEYAVVGCYFVQQVWGTVQMLGERRSAKASPAPEPDVDWGDLLSEWDVDEEEDDEGAAWAL